MKIEGEGRFFARETEGRGKGELKRVRHSYTTTAAAATVQQQQHNSNNNGAATFSCPFFFLVLCKRVVSGCHTRGEHLLPVKVMAESILKKEKSEEKSRKILHRDLRMCAVLCNATTIVVYARPRRAKSPPIKKAACVPLLSPSLCV